MATTSTVPYIKKKIALLRIVKEVVQGIPNWSFTASGGSSTTITINTTSGNTHDNNLAAMVDDFFNSAQVYFLSSTSTSALQGKMYNVTDSARSGSTVTLTVDTMAASPSSGDVFYLWWPMKAANLSMNLGRENVERDFIRMTLDPPSSVKGLKVCDGSFDVEMTALETSAGDGTAPGIDRFSALLSVYGTRSVSVGEAVTGSSSTTTQVDVTDASTFTVGQYVLINNEVRRITTVDTASTPDNIIVSPALSTAPSASDVVYTAEEWTPDDDGHQTLTILHNEDDRMTEIRGAVCSVKIACAVAEFPVLSLEFNAAYIDGSGNENGWDISDAATEYDGTHPSKLPTVYRTSGARHFGSTALTIASMEFDAAHDRQEHRYVDQHYFSIEGRKAIANVQFKDTSVTAKETWEANGTQAHLLLAIGKSAGDCILIAGNAQVQDPVGMEDNNGFADWSASFGFVDDQTESTAKKPIIARF